MTRIPIKFIVRWIEFIMCKTFIQMHQISLPFMTFLEIKIVNSDT